MRIKLSLRYAKMCNAHCKRVRNEYETEKIHSIEKMDRLGMQSRENRE